MILPVDPENQRSFDERINSKLPDGAERPKPKEPEVNVYTRFNKLLTEDMRARIRVPGNYIKYSTVGSLNLQQFKNGIIFPYTPVIGYSHKADYQNVLAVHTNYAQQFYKSSNVTEINIEARFTVQNAEEASVYLSLKHLLSALTKMLVGDDAGAGAPPPICRLDAYGTYMLKDVPIVITGYKVLLPNDVDYFSVFGEGVEGRTDQFFGIDKTNPNDLYLEKTISNTGQNLVPTISTFSITCVPLYSRREMLKFTVKNFIEDYPNNTKYL